MEDPELNQSSQGVAPFAGRAEAGLVDSIEDGDSGRQFILEQQLRGARAVAKVALVACAISVPFCAGIVFFLDVWLGLALLGIVAVVGGYEALVLALIARGQYRQWLDGVCTAVEVSVPTVIAVIDSVRVGPEYALTSAPVMLYGLAVLVSALRLRPCLVLLAGGLGAAQMLTLFAGLQSRLDPLLVERLPSLGVSNVTQRAAYVLLAGIIGWFFCRSLLRSAHNLSTQWIARQKSERERLILEEQLHQAQKMEAIGQLAGGVAHDFNNQLTAILGYCEFLEEQVTDSKQLEDVAEIRRAGERAATLTNQLLTFSRKQTFRTGIVDLNALVSDAGRMLERMVGEDIVLRFLPGSGPLSVRVDPNRLEQVLVNLVINARDSMPQGGLVRIETGWASEDEDVEKMSATESGWVFIDVIDNGEGMTPEVMSRLFEPFFTTKAQGKGTGLGLATAYGAVKQFGGHLSVKSSPGVGSTFRILLPASTETPEVKAPSLPMKSARGGETILVVEDENDLRRFVVRVLRRAGYIVLSAVDAEAALASVHEYQEEIHLLLTDVVMPGRTGKELWESLRLLRPGVRVLFMSGYARNILGEHVSLGPDTPLISKPFSAAELTAMVYEVLGNQ